MASTLICPISNENIDKSAARIGAILTGLFLVAYAVTGAWQILLVVFADYVLRVLTPYQPPISLLARGIARTAGVAPRTMNKGPKIFAWRVGFLMAVAATAFLPVDPAASIVVAVALAGFNFLDGVGNLCVGCVIYTYVVLPWLGPGKVTAGAS
jgi:hypothetical protein